MASQYSILRQYAPYVSPYNIDLVKDVMMYKQQKVDAAREKIYTQVDYLMGQEIDKPEARAYMEDKMSGVIANINQNSKAWIFLLMVLREPYKERSVRCWMIRSLTRLPAQKKAGECIKCYLIYK